MSEENQQSSENQNQQSGDNGGDGGGGGGGDAVISWDLPTLTAGLSDDSKSYLTKKGHFKEDMTGPMMIDRITRSLENAESKLGGNVERMVELPELDKIGEVDFWRKNFNAPESGDGYELKAPDGVKINEPYQKHMADAAAKLGVPPHMLQGLVQATAEFAGQAETDMMTATAQQQEDARKNMNGILQTEWGAETEKNITLAQEASHFIFDGIAGEEELQKLNNAMGGDATLVRMMHRISTFMGEDQLKEGRTALNHKLSPANAKVRLNEMHADPAVRKAWDDANDPRHRELVSERDRLVRIKNKR